MITRLGGVQSPRIKIFSHDGGIAPIDFVTLEGMVNNFFLANPSYLLVNIDYEMFERIQPSPDLYTKVVVVTYKT
jgi:hypothetical protein